MKHIWTVVCENSSVDKETNLLSLFNCVEQITLTSNKGHLLSKEGIIINVNFQLISFWTIKDKNKDNELDIKLEIIAPNGNSLFSYDNHFKINKGNVKFRNIIKISTLKIIGEGRYIIKMMCKKNKTGNFEIVSESPLDVKILYKLPNLSKKN